MKTKTSKGTKEVVIYSETRKSINFVDLGPPRKAKCKVCQNCQGRSPVCYGRLRALKFYSIFYTKISRKRLKIWRRNERSFFVLFNWRHIITEISFSSLFNLFNFDLRKYTSISSASFLANFQISLFFFNINEFDSIKNIGKTYWISHSWELSKGVVGRHCYQVTNRKSIYR